MKIRFAYIIVGISLNYGFAFKRIVYRCYKTNKVKKLMNTKNLISRSVERVNSFTIQDLAIDLIELSEKDLQNISGGRHNGCGCGGTTTTTTTTTSNGGTTTTTTTTTSSLRQSASALRIDSIFS